MLTLLSLNRTCNSQQAYEYFVSTLNMEATSVEVISNLAELLIESGHYAEAERYLKYGLKDYAESEILLGTAG